MSGDLSPAVRQELDKVAALLDESKYQHQLVESLPEGVSLERFTRTAKNAIQTNPDLLQADRLSLFLAVKLCAKDGLLPDGREAALVKVGKKVAYWPMIGGLRKKAAECGWALEARVVYINDEFRYEAGSSPHIHHVPVELGDERGDPIGAYAIATNIRTGMKMVGTPMTVAEIEAVRATSRAGQSEYGPWVKWWDRMAEKTVARRLWATLPLAYTPSRAGRVFDPEVEEAVSDTPEVAGLEPVAEIVE